MAENLNYYKVFLAVVKTGSISKAASSLYISQPAVSKAISNLEDSLSVKLFERTKQGVTLTEEGLIIYKHISQAFETIKNGENEIKKINELGIATLKIGVSTSLCKHILLDYLKDFIIEHPHIKLIIDCHSTKNTIKRLEEGSIDLGLICATELPKDTIYKKLTTIHDIFVSSESYLSNLKLRENSDASLNNSVFFAGNITNIMNDNDTTTSEAELSTVDIIEKSNLMLLEKDNITRNHIDKYLYDNEINPSQVLEINNMDLLIDFAEIGMGVSCIVKEFALDKLKDKKIFALPLETPIAEREVGFIYKSMKKDSPTIEKFLKYCFG